jgi:ABC-2 type transport system permease protein
MRDLKTVFRFEMQNKLNQKSIRVTTIIILAILFLVTCIPTFKEIFSAPGSEAKGKIADEKAREGENIGTVEYGYVVLKDSPDSDAVGDIYPFSHSKTFSDEESLRKAVKEGEIKKGIILYSPTSYKLITNDISMHDYSVVMISENLQKYNRNVILIRNGINPDEVDKAENIQIQVDTEILGKNAASGFAFAYAGMFAIYMMIILYGNSVATSVAREKNDRTMELLITNTTSNNLIWGKVLASTVVSIAQLLLMIVVLGVGIKVNQVNYPEFIINSVKEGITVDALIIFIIFALFGTLMYYFLYASVGALVSKVEEVNSAMTPIQFVFIGAFFLSSIGMNMPEGMLMRIASIVPFVSPMAMFIRYSLTTVPIVDIIAGITLLIATTAFMAYLAVRIYRMGTLNYGNRIGFIKAVNMVFMKEIIK